MNANQMTVGLWYWVHGRPLLLQQLSVSKGYHQFLRLDEPKSVDEGRFVPNEQATIQSSRAVNRAVDPHEATAHLDRIRDSVKQTAELRADRELLTGWAEILSQEAEILVQVKMPLLGLPTNGLSVFTPTTAHATRYYVDHFRGLSDLIEWVDALIEERVKAGVPLSPLEAKRQREEAERDAV